MGALDEDLISDPKHPEKQPGTAAHAYKPSIEEQRQVDPVGSAASKPRQNIRHPVQRQ